ncbi:baculoviral IAP repeat-containing protein 7-like [Elysia marginata]|uniref:Baculoviral IAP repeat-containing protein 7-like n=1 Tax=Elysia marginata TaxID=1093978 RepID=A0AAV4GVG8_9GAST|nr:baculoviral IAP repeat-containing protein 7-like [Elysia marginata]
MENLGNNAHGMDIGPGVGGLWTHRQNENQTPSSDDGRMLVQVVSGVRADGVIEYEPMSVVRPPSGVFYEPLDYGTVPQGLLPATSRRPLYHETNRLSTFYSRWSIEYCVAPQDLARDGFYYVGPGDKVRCIFCQKHVWGWEPGDSVTAEHRRLYPNCPFILGRCAKMNVPLNPPEDILFYTYNVNVRLNREEGKEH